jgi:hypothetical protein
MFADRSKPRSVGEAIGFAVMAFSQLEMMVNFHACVTMTRTTKCGDESQALGRLLSYSAKVDLLEAMLKVRAGDGRLPEGTDELLGRLRTAGALRNELMHGEWLGYPSELRAGLGRTAPRAKPFPEDWERVVSAGDLAAAASEFTKTTHDLGRFMVGLPERFLPPPGRE